MSTFCTFFLIPSRCSPFHTCPSMLRKGGTFRAIKDVPVGAKGLTLKQHIEHTLGTKTIEEAVNLPPGEDLNEWLAVNTVFFYNALNVLYRVLDETLCTAAGCPSMSAGPQYEYLWAFPGSRAPPQRLSAPAYVHALFDWVEAQIDDPAVFPQAYGAPFPANFTTIVSTILRRLFRVYAHIYHSHFRQIVRLELEPHLNTCFKHFVLFTRSNGLLDEREFAPLRELIAKMTGGK